MTTPYYLYDTALLQATLRTIQQEIAQYPHFRVHYALKANTNPALLSFIHQAGLGADCVSGGEIEIAIKAGFPAQSIVYAGVGKSDWEILLALKSNILCFNVESKEELQVIQQLAQQENKVARVCLRVNPDVHAHTHMHIATGAATDKFGIPLDELLDIIAQAQCATHIELLGLHFHIGSQITDMHDFILLCQRVNSIQDQLNAAQFFPSMINVGGGLGVDYSSPWEHPIPDFHGYFQVFAQHLQLRDGQTLHFELGRSVVAQCGSLITQVLYVKESGGKRFTIVDAGMNDLLRPALYGAQHAIEKFRRTSEPLNSSSDAPEPSKLPYDIVGPICESADVFARDYLLPITQRGDLLAIRSAGAYGETMASTYNSRKLPQSRMV